MKKSSLIIKVREVLHTPAIFSVFRFDIFTNVLPNTILLKYRQREIAERSKGPSHYSNLQNRLRD